MRSARFLSKIAVIVLSAIISFQSAGWLLAWQGLNLENKWAAQRILRQGEKDCNRAGFAKKTFLQLRIAGADEIRIQGQLFDFQIIGETSDSLFVRLYHDAEEEALIGALDIFFQSSINGSSPTEPGTVVWLAQWLGAVYLLPEKPILPPSDPADESRSNFCVSGLVPQSSPGIFAPPPEC